MPVLNFDTVLYVTQAASNILNFPVEQTSSTCPACKKDQATGDGGEHIVFTSDNGSRVVFISCDRVKLLDPNLCGLPDPTWLPYPEKIKKDKRNPNEPGLPGLARVSSTDPSGEPSPAPVKKPGKA